jgi:hypothetical protein
MPEEAIEYEEDEFLNPDNKGDIGDSSVLIGHESIQG